MWQTINMSSVLAAVLLGGLLSLAFTRAAGRGGLPPIGWHPTSWLCEAGVLGKMTVPAWCGFFIWLFACLSTFVWPLFGSMILVALAAPLPWVVADYFRRDASAKNSIYIFHNPFQPVTSAYERHIEGGIAEDVRQTVFLYLDNDDLKSLSTTISSYEEAYLAGIRIGMTPLYSAEATNEFLQVYDSLKLGRFVVHVGNKKAMLAFADALEAVALMASAKHRPPTHHVSTNRPYGPDQQYPDPTSATSEDVGEYNFGEEEVGMSHDEDVFAGLNDESSQNPEVLVSPTVVSDRDTSGPPRKGKKTTVSQAKNRPSGVRINFPPTTERGNED